MSNPDPSPATRFRPGDVNNPRGRPRIVSELREACRTFTPAVVERLKREVDENGPEWLAASKMLLAYGWGTPRQSIEVSRADEYEIVEAPRRRLDVRQLTTPQLEALKVLMPAFKLIGADPTEALAEINPAEVLAEPQRKRDALREAYIRAVLLAKHNAPVRPRQAIEGFRRLSQEENPVVSPEEVATLEALIAACDVEPEAELDDEDRDRD